MRLSLLSALSTSLLLTTAVQAANVDLMIEESGIIDSQINDSAELAELARLGTSLETGDFNNDGLTDLAISTPSASSPRGISRAGRVSIYFGGTTVQNLGETVFEPDDDKADVLIFGLEQDERIGEKMAVGDVNGDGTDDLILVAQRNKSINHGRDETRVYIIFGRQTFPAQMELLTDADVVLKRDGLMDASGGFSRFVMHFSAVATGDLNGDNIDDIGLIDNENFLVQILYGRNDWSAEIGLEDGEDVRFEGDGAELFEVTMENMIDQGLLFADVNNDNIDDLIIGFKETDVTGPPALEDAGAIYIFFGSADFPAAPMLANADITLTGGLNRDFAGETLGVGDVNGNGLVDLVIGNPISSLGVVSATGFGRLHIVYDIATRGATFDLFNADVTLKLSDDNGRIGFKTGNQLIVEDVNGDAIADIITSTPQAFFNSITSNGWVHILYGSDSLSANIDLDTDGDIFLIAPEPTNILASGRFGGALALADLNNDGRQDLAVGAPDGRTNKPSGGVSIASGWVAIFSDIANKTANTAPVAVDDTAIATSGIATSIDILTNDTDDGTIDPTTVSILDTPDEGSIVDNNDGTVTYTPGGNFEGTDTFTYTVNDENGATSNVATVTITVSMENAAPQANDDSASTTPGEAVSISVLDNDIDDGTLAADSVEVVSQPANGSAAANADGTVTYTPNAGFTGSDTFTYTVNDDDGETSNAATVTVEVTEVNDGGNATLDPTTLELHLPVVEIPGLGSLDVTLVFSGASPDGLIVAFTVDPARLAVSTNTSETPATFDGLTLNVPVFYFADTAYSIPLQLVDPNNLVFGADLTQLMQVQ